MRWHSILRTLQTVKHDLHQCQLRWEHQLRPPSANEDHSVRCKAWSTVCNIGSSSTSCWNVWQQEIKMELVVGEVGCIPPASPQHWRSGNCSKRQRLQRIFSWKACLRWRNACHVYFTRLTWNFYLLGEQQKNVVPISRSLTFQTKVAEDARQPGDSTMKPVQGVCWQWNSVLATSWNCATSIAPKANLGETPT